MERDQKRGEERKERDIGRGEVVRGRGRRGRRV